MTQDELKKAVAKAAIEHVSLGAVLGVGSGSTVNYFIAELARIKHKVDAAVASSERTAQLLRQAGIEVVDLNSVAELDVYIDGADEITPGMAMIKGGGGALTREKIVAAVSRKFICIADESKLVDTLGKFPLPVEVIPMARSYVGRMMVGLGGLPVLREGFVTDNGNIILDVHRLRIEDPLALETKINQIVGVVTCGIFARRGADLLLLATNDGIKTLRAT